MSVFHKKKSMFASIMFFEFIIISVLTVGTCAPEFAVELKAEVADSISSGLSDVLPEKIDESSLDSATGSAIDSEDNDTQNITDITDNTDTDIIDTDITNVSGKEDEVRAVWISFIEFSEQLEQLGDSGFSKSDFQEYIDEVFDHCVTWNMNTVIVHVRPYGDAFYPSEYFPWSEYISGKQGKAPGFDPLEYMVQAAHERDLRFEAWLNPYRVATGTTKASSLSADNPARKWMRSSKASTRRNVLAFSGNLYYNPAKKAVRDLITNGVREIVENYDVDAIHFDDYFYPSLAEKWKPKAKAAKSSYGNYFDYKEYDNYADNCKDNEEIPLSLVKWRRENVNKLVRSVYKAVKEANPETQFGISPAGNIDNLLDKKSYYVDIENWLSSSEYVDYICPQIYWSFDNAEYSFDTVAERWMDICVNSDIKLYIGIAVYKAAAGKNTVWDWAQWHNKTTILKKQVVYCRNQEDIDGFSFFSYQNFTQKSKRKEINNLLEIL